MSLISPGAREKTASTSAFFISNILVNSSFASKPRTPSFSLSRLREYLSTISAKTAPDFIFLSTSFISSSEETMICLIDKMFSRGMISHKRIRPTVVSTLSPSIRTTILAWRSTAFESYADLTSSGLAKILPFPLNPSISLVR